MLGDGGHPAEGIEHGEGGEKGDDGAVAAAFAEGEDRRVGEVVVAPRDVAGDFERELVGEGKRGRDLASGKRFDFGGWELGEGGATGAGVGIVEGGDHAAAALEGGCGKGCGIEAGGEEVGEVFAQGGDGGEVLGEWTGDDGRCHVAHVGLLAKALSSRINCRAIRLWEGAMEIAGKVALVTGAGSGIGRACAERLAREGAKVVVVDVDVAGGEETVRRVTAAGGEAAFVRGDVGTPEGIAETFRAAKRVFGRLDIVHNNAGIMTGDTPGWPDAPLEKVFRVIAVNTSGVVMGTRAAVEAFREHGEGGVVVNTASIAGLGPLPFDPVYAASKAAVIHFTKSCAILKELENVRVNAVAPGMVDTPIIAKTGDGTRPAKWLEPSLEGAVLLPPERIAEEVVRLIRDDTLAGEVSVVMHESAQPAAGG